MIDESPFTTPENFQVTIKGFDSEENARDLGQIVAAYIKEISKVIGLSCLDGVTIATNYPQALLELDRGYPTTYNLTASDGSRTLSDGNVEGVAMTPCVIRDGKIKSHIIMNAKYVAALNDEKNEDFGLAFHLLAHECAHVEVTQHFDIAFPETLLRKTTGDIQENLRLNAAMICWDEFAVTYIVANYGENQTDNYEKTFIKYLEESRLIANECIKKFRLHADINTVVGEVYKIYGNLMKYGAYHLGNMGGRDLKMEDMPNTLLALKDNWFAPYFNEMKLILEEIGKDYGKWEDKVGFDKLEKLIDEIVKNGGIYFHYLEDGTKYIDIPYTPDTMPE